MGRRPDWGIGLPRSTGVRQTIPWVLCGAQGALIAHVHENERLLRLRLGIEAGRRWETRSQDGWTVNPQITIIAATLEFKGFTSLLS